MKKSIIPLDRLHVSLDGKSAVLIISSVLLLTIQHYRQLTSLRTLDRLVLYLLVPLVIIVLAWREPPTRYGLRLGNWRLGLLLTSAAVIAIAPALELVARTPDFRAYYGQAAPAWGPLLLDSAAHLFGWEFFFRGFLLFGLAQRYGDDAILLQAVPFAIAHFGKPELETLSTIFGGAAFGYVALKTDSMLYPFLIHCFVLVLTTALAAGMI